MDTDPVAEAFVNEADATLLILSLTANGVLILIIIIGGIVIYSS